MSDQFPVVWVGGMHCPGCGREYVPGVDDFEVHIAAHYGPGWPQPADVEFLRAGPVCLDCGEQLLTTQVPEAQVPAERWELWAGTGWLRR